MTEANKKKGKQPKALTNDMDITEVVKEEEKAYIGDQFRLNSNYDSQIAATAISNGMVLVTHNTADFEPMKEKSFLRMEDWFLAE